MNLKTIFKFMTYNTKQKELIFKVVARQRKDFTVQDILQKTKGKVGLTTVYRCIDEMERDGSLTKSIGPDNTAFYHYLRPCKHDDHFYLRCDSCSKLTHIDCEHIGSLFEHIVDKHGFSPSKEHVIIAGTCKKCAKKEAK